MNYTIGNLFNEYFGQNVRKGYRPQTGEGNTDDNLVSAIYSGIEFIDSNHEAQELSFLGTQILFPITFLGGSYKKYNSRGELIDIPMVDFRLPAATIVDFKRSKNISETSMNGGYGEVNEIYGFKSWEINFMGFFLDDPGQPQGLKSAFDQEREMIRWDNLASSINVLGWLFNEKDINAITIKDISISTLRGKPGIRPFSISAKSDEAVELLIRNS